MKELLVPVGNMECLRVAINAGADAVYLGGKRFGARAFAGNFTDEEMIEAISLCHLYGVKIYVTVNTLIYESEFKEAFAYVKFLYENGVDAVIMQDIGLISYTRKYLPDLDIHASTQVHNTNQDTIDYLYNLGVKRIVFAREMSVDEIDDVKSDIEKEAFIHGAICISYSGECLFSSCILNRSGNRGECAQMCRLPYKLYHGDKMIKTEGDYLLSPKELNTSSDFARILSSSIYSLKIEGRMKSAEYVGCVTRLYRDLLDKYYANQPLEVDEAILDDLRVIFNREFTKGFILNASNKELLNPKSSNHLGVSLGEVSDITSKYITIDLKRDLNQGDGIRFKDEKEGMILNYLYDLKGNLINAAKKGDKVLIDNRFSVKKGEEVLKTLDVKVKEKYLHLKEKKIPVTLKLNAHIGSPLELCLSDGINEVKKSYGMVFEAKTSPLTKERISEQLNKLGDTPFIIQDEDISMDDNIFINIKDINELRRMSSYALMELRSCINRHVPEIKEEKISYSYDAIYHVTCLVRNEEQMKAALDHKVDVIYVTDDKLYQQYKNYDNVLYRLNRVKDSFGGPSLKTYLGSLMKGKEGIGDYYLNVTNHYSIDELCHYLKRVTLSVELTDEEIANIMKHYENQRDVEMIIYGTYELMLMKYCPLNCFVNQDRVCHACMDPIPYYLVDRFNKRYPILSEPKYHLTHLLNATVTDKISNIPFYKKQGINYYRLELLNEDYEETSSLITKVYQSLNQ